MIRVALWQGVLVALLFFTTLAVIVGAKQGASWWLLPPIFTGWWASFELVASVMRDGLFGRRG